MTKFQDGSPLITNDSISEQRFNLIENGFVCGKRRLGFSVDMFALGKCNAKM